MKPKPKVPARKVRRARKLPTSTDVSLVVAAIERTTTAVLEAMRANTDAVNAAQEASRQHSESIVAAIETLTALTMEVDDDDDLADTPMLVEEGRPPVMADDPEPEGKE
jgi:histone H3/H4